MIPAFGTTNLPQNLSTGKVHVPGWSCILSVHTARGSWHLDNGEREQRVGRRLHKPARDEGQGREGQGAGRLPGSLHGGRGVSLVRLCRPSPLMS